MSTTTPVYSRLLGLADNPTYVGRTLTLCDQEEGFESGTILDVTVSEHTLVITTASKAFTFEDDDTTAAVQNSGSVILTRNNTPYAVIDRTDGPRLTPPPARP